MHFFKCKELSGHGPGSITEEGGEGSSWLELTLAGWPRGSLATCRVSDTPVTIPIVQEAERQISKITERLN